MYSNDEFGSASEMFGVDIILTSFEYDSLYFLGHFIVKSRL